MPSRAVIFNDSHGRTIVFVDPLPCRRGGEHVTSKRTDAALRVLQWELDGHGNEVLEAMLAHPDMNLAEAVVLIERENPEWTEDAPRRGQPEEAPEAPTRRTRASPELTALQQEFATFKHLLKPVEAREVEAAFREVAENADPESLAALRRRVRILALQAAFWRELAGPAKPMNALGLIVLQMDGSILAQSGATEYLGEEDVFRTVRAQLTRGDRGVYVMHLPVGRLIIARGKSVAIATLFRHAPGKEVVSVLERTVTAIEENSSAADRTFRNVALAGRYAEALLKLVQRVAG